ncbi:hypothetical protein [Speluncibacter jeojiensis]|uniref:PPE family domain-containing protein n=1 Tax=Speluncibacter jeojiensis TaxID=2710754 RepID=A0A9X4RGM1_9ACTN|nr:hypothetical protein [Corynebacteriales bacterium D3-21]
MLLGGNGGASPSESPMPLIPGISTTTAAPEAPSLEGGAGELPRWASLFPGVSPAEQELDRLAHNESLMAQGAYGGTDGAYVTVFENFQGWTHQRIFDAVGELDSTATDSVARGWTTLAAAADELLMKAFTKIQSTIGAEWEGDGATAAAQAVTAFANSGHSFTQGMRATALKIESAAVTTDAVKAQVPVPATPAADILMITSPQSAQMMAEEERQRAILAMQTTYVPGFTQAGTGVPLLAPPHNAVNGFSMPGTAGMTGGSGGGPVGINGVYQGDSFDGGAPVDPAGAGSGAPGAGSDGPADAYRAPGPGGGGDAEGGLQDGFGGMPAGTQSAGLSPADSLGTNRSGSGGSMGSHAGGAGSLGSGSGMGGLGVVVPGVGGGFGGSGGGYDGSSGGSFGGAVPGPGSGSGAGGSTGRGVAGGSVAEEQAATAAAKAARSTSRSVGAMPHGARQNGDDDEEYRPASYLVSAGNGSELIGELPMVVPAVIGAFVEDDR